MTKLLSIIVPVYRVEEYLPKCLDSLVNQDYKNVEIIVVDDGSPDNCPAICDEYAAKDSRIKVIHKTNDGQASARNRGLDVACGDYITFVDSDDSVCPEIYTSMIGALEEVDADIAQCGYITYTGLRIKKQATPPRFTTWNTSEEVMRDYLQTHYINGLLWNKVYKRSIWKDVRIPEGVYREDVYVIFRVLAKCNKLVHVGDCYYNYLIREGSSEHREFDPKFLISIKISDERYDFVKEHFPSLKIYAERSCYGARISAIRKIVRSHSEKAYGEILLSLKNYLANNKPLTGQQKKDSFLILYLPFLYRIKMDYEHKWRNNLKRYLISLIKRR